MRRPTLALAAVLTLAVAPVADARDTRQQFDIATAIAAGKADGTLDGSVQFHFKGARAPAVAQRLGPANTNRKTNAFGKSDGKACQWVFLGALKALQEAARERGANAVVDIESKAGLELEQFVGIFGFGRLQGRAATGVVRVELNTANAQDIPVNHNARFAPVIHPTLETGVQAMSVAALDAFVGG